MSIETRVTNGANQRLPIKKWHMGTVSRIFIPPSNTEVDNVNTSFAVFRSQKHVSGFYISVDKVFGVDIPNSRNLRRNARSERYGTEVGNTHKPSGQHQGGLDAKPTSTLFTDGLEIDAQ
jgi:hypothetical protein